MSKFDAPILDAPDQRLRKIYLKAQAGAALSDADYNRVAQRQGVQADNKAQGGVNMDLATARDKNGKLAPDSYDFAGKLTKDEVKAKETEARINEQQRIANQQRERELDIVSKQAGISTPPRKTPETPVAPPAPTPAPTPVKDPALTFNALGTPDDLFLDPLRARRGNARSTFAV